MKPRLRPRSPACVAASVPGSLRRILRRPWRTCDAATCALLVATLVLLLAPALMAEGAGRLR